MSQRERFEELKAMGNLPTPSKIALEMLRLTRSDTAGLPEIANLIEKDPALSGRLLKYANSAAFSMGRPVVAIVDATINLGLRVVRNLALGFSLVANCRTGRCSAFDYSTFWTESLATAVASRSLSSRRKCFNRDEVFTCGLLSQVGRLALASVFSDEYAEILTHTSDENEILQLEFKKFAISNRQMTAELLNEWGIPDFLIAGVAAHQQLEKMEINDARICLLANQLNLASHIARLCVSEQPAPEKFEKMQERVRDYGMDDDDFSDLFDEVVQTWQEWGQLFEFSTRPLPPYSELRKQSDEDQQDSNNGDQEGFWVLVVDNDPKTRKSLEELLSADGNQVLVASDGEEGLKLAVEHNPQMILTDWDIPKLDGIAFCKSLRAAEFAQTIYIIMVTERKSDAEIVQAFDAGVDDFVAKPFTRKILEARIRSGQRLLEQKAKINLDNETIRNYAVELETTNRRLELMAMTDELTGLPNRRLGMERLRQLWTETTRTKAEMSCILIDIDNFKDFNDQYGHDCGDWVLKDIAELFRQTVRGDDVVCRMGGEEFCVICANTGLDDCHQLAERLRNAVSQHKIVYENQSTSTTISLGTATRAAKLNDYAALLKAADDALYESKKEGRNRVTVALVNR